MKFPSLLIFIILFVSLVSCNSDTEEVSEVQCDLYEQSAVRDLNRELIMSNSDEISTLIANKYQIPVQDVSGPISFPDVNLTGYRWRLANSNLQYTIYYEDEALERVQVGYPIEMENRYTVLLSEVLNCLGAPDYYDIELTSNIDEFTHGAALYYVEEQRVLSLLTTSDRPLPETADTMVMLNWVRYAPASSVEELIEYVYGIDDPALLEDVMNSIQPWE